MGKPKVSTDWLAGCSGCHMSLLDMDERIAAVLELGRPALLADHRPQTAG